MIYLISIIYSDYNEQHNKNYKVGIFAIFIAAALIGSVVAFGDNMAFAGGKHKKSNDSEQEMNKAKRMNNQDNVSLEQYH